MIVSNRFLSVFASVLMGGLLAFSPSARAEEPRLMATHGEWSAYVFEENGGKVCYMAAQPKNEKGDYQKRGDVFAHITHRPGSGAKDVFSYLAGYGYKKDSRVSVKIDGRTFDLFTDGETAWADDSQTDSAIARAIRGGSQMVVTGTSSRGTLTTDTFSLKGSSKAYEKISRECAVR